MHHKLKSFKLTAWLCLLISGVYSQTICEKIYDKPDTLAHYGNEKIALRQYVQVKLIPILGDCIKQKMEFVNNMTIKFIIDDNDSIIDVNFLKPKLTDYCSNNLKSEILNMKDWKSGKIGSNKVCSAFTYEIAGIKWH